MLVNSLQEENTAVIKNRLGLYMSVRHALYFREDSNFACGEITDSKVNTSSVQYPERIPLHIDLYECDSS